MIQRGEKSYKQHTEVTLKNSRSALGVKKVPRTHLAKGFQISNGVPLKLSQPLVYNALNQSRAGGPIDGVRGSSSAKYITSRHPPPPRTRTKVCL
jgi:hypothetical protein